MNVKIILVILLAIVFVSCEKVEVVMVDNTTDQDMLVKFEDGMSLNIPANTVRRMTMKAKPTNVFINDTLIQSVDPSMDEYDMNLLNPSLEKYYIEQIKYGSGRSSKGDTPMNFIKVDDFVYPGRVRVDSSFFISDNWDFGLEDVIQEKIEVSGNNNRKKIFRYRDFRSHAKNSYRKALSR